MSVRSTSYSTAIDSISLPSPEYPIFEFCSGRRRISLASQGEEDFPVQSPILLKEEKIKKEGFVQFAEITEDEHSVGNINWKKCHLSLIEQTPGEAFLEFDFFLPLSQVGLSVEPTGEVDPSQVVKSLTDPSILVFRIINGKKILMKGESKDESDAWLLAISPSEEPRPSTHGQGQGQGQGIWTRICQFFRETQRAWRAARGARGGRRPIEI